MNLELKECIKDAYDDIMRSYYQSEEYLERDQEFNRLLDEFKHDLSPEMCHLLDKVLEARLAVFSGEALEALYRGVVNCIALCNDVK